MQPKGSFPHSQVPATCPYPEPGKEYDIDVRGLGYFFLNIGKWGGKLSYMKRKNVFAKQEENLAKCKTPSAKQAVPSVQFVSNSDHLI